MSDYTCEHGKIAMGRYCEKCQAERDAEKLRAKANAPVQGTVPRDLAEDVKAAMSNAYNDAVAYKDCTEHKHIAAELTRVGWVHSSQATAVNEIPYLRALLIAAGESWGDWCEEGIGEMGKFLAERLQEPSQATGGGLSGEARDTCAMALLALENDAFRKCSAHDISIDTRETICRDIIAARAELAALPVRGDGRGVGT